MEVYCRRGLACLLSLSVVGLLAFVGCTPNPPDVPDTYVVEWTVIPEGSGHVNQTADGAMVTLVVVAAEGWEFDGWVNPVIPDESPVTVDAQQIESVEAAFTEIIVDDPPPGTPVDRDDDGIIDQSDDCPDTPADEVDDINANGCGPSERDSDDDGIMDDADLCASTPATVEIDDDGCPVSEPGTPDADGDGVPDDIDQCPDTPRREVVDANGCPASERDSDDDGVTDNLDECPDTPAVEEAGADGCAQSQLDTDEDGVSNADDACPDTVPGTVIGPDGCPEDDPVILPPPGGAAVCGDGSQEGAEECDDGNTTDGDGCSSTCTIEPVDSVCGNGIPETGETCDDGNTVGGDGCDSTCQIEGPPNDFCNMPTTVEDGTRSFSNVDATTDGPDEPTMCDFFERTNVQSDVWYCHTASCTGELLISLCGSDFDTKMAVYDGCDCPTEEPLVCSDDDCGTGVENVQSRVTIQAIAGQDYMIRIGGFVGEQGDGRMTILCGAADACGDATGDCFVDSPTGEAGCGDAECCATTCELDRFCCDIEWDSFCADEATGVCTDGFPACQTGIGSCGQPRGSDPGCGNVDCCNTVCDSDPYCCITSWDESCVKKANSMCLLSCHTRAGDCFAGHDGAGCNDISCCAQVCPTDEYCCETEWDEECAAKAETLCTQ